MPNIRADSLLREIREAPPRSANRLARFRSEALHLVMQEHLIEPAFCCRIVELEQTSPDALVAEGEILHAPRLLPETGELTALACGVATLGSGLERKVTSLFADRKRTLALALDQLGNELLHALSRRLQDSMWVMARRLGLTLAGELRPGDPGLALQAQGSLLRLAAAERIGVQVTSGQALQPLKSVSVLLGAGAGLPRVSWSRCDDCRSRARCKLANASDVPALV